MKLDDDINISQAHRIAAYSEGGFTLQDKRVFQTSIIICATELFTDWLPVSVKKLTWQHLKKAIELKPEVLILGTGASSCPLNETLSWEILSHQIGFEVMDTGAACRSYNLLLAENREVVAALVPIWKEQKV